MFINLTMFILFLSFYHHVGSLASKQRTQVLWIHQQSDSTLQELFDSWGWHWREYKIYEALCMCSPPSLKQIITPVISLINKSQLGYNNGETLFVHIFRVKKGRCNVMGWPRFHRKNSIFQGWGIKRFYNPSGNAKKRLVFAFGTLFIPKISLSLALLGFLR